MGALIMSHSDDNGLVLPPTLAPHQVVIVPIYKTLEQRDEIGRHVEPLIAELKKRGIRVRYDDADNKGSPGGILRIRAQGRTRTPGPRWS